ncbi:50S ribosomal protein L20 [candidate division FCPU426 bacterium]|nr:50S ribosomal protein L20 [candidate division FCPU426 bacterium]
MPRVKGGVTTRARKKKVFKRTKGYWGNKKNQFRQATEQVRRSLRYATRDRKTKKREFRGLWIARINAAARGNGLSYSQFIKGLKTAAVIIDRKVLAEIAINDAKAFTEIAAIAKQALAA